MSKIADSIRRGLEQAVAYAEGNANESAYRIRASEQPRRPCKPREAPRHRN
jgi:putative transcriptional regulator